LPKSAVRVRRSKVSVWTGSMGEWMLASGEDDCR